MLARSLSRSRLFATPARELKDRLGSRCLLPLTELQLHPKQQKQIQPQRAHEMPVVRGGVQSTSPQHGPVNLNDHADQASEPSKHMESMRHRQYIEKRVADVAGESESLGPELHPSQRLARNKQQSQEQGHIKPAGRTGGMTSVLLASHKGSDPAARYFESNAT